MKITKYIAIAIFSLIVSTTANAKEVEVEARGVGDDYNWAVLDAVENAVRQTSNIYINKSTPEAKAVVKGKASIKTEENKLLSKSKTKEAEVKHDISAEIKTIEAYYSGKVKSYSVIKEEEKNDKFYVTIKAIVEVTEDYKSPSLVKKADYTIAVMPFDGLKSYNCGKGVISLGVLNNNLSNSLNSKISKTRKLSVVNRADLDKYADELSLVAHNLTREKDKNKLRNIASADYMLVGSISEFQSSVSTKKIEMTGEEYSKSRSRITINYSLIETATTEVIFSDTALASINKEGSKTSCEKSLRDLSDQVSNDITKDMLSVLFPDYEYEAPVMKKHKKKTTTTTTTTTTTRKREAVKLPFD